MTMEKTGDIGDHTPQREPDNVQRGSKCCGGSCKQPLTKEGADKLEKSVSNSAIDAVAQRTKENQ